MSLMTVTGMYGETMENDRWTKMMKMMMMMMMMMMIVVLVMINS
jgi:hypothetical protein